METSMSAPAPEPRVLHVDDGAQWRGGQHQVLLLMSELARLGVDQRLVARPGSPLAARARAAGLAAEEMRLGPEWNLFGWRRLARVARATGANVIHAHTSHAHAHALRAARRLGARVRLVTTRRVDFAIAQNRASLRKYLDPRQHYIAISSGVLDALTRGGVAPSRVSLVPSGVPPIAPETAWSRVRVREALGIAPDELAIVNVGALVDHKGQRYLVGAAPRVLEAFAHARIHILGEGGLRRALQNQIRRMGLERRVVLHGFVEDARLKLAGFDLYVASSHLEGLGTAMLDAMLAGLPVVAAAAGGIPDAVEDGKTGRLCPVRDTQALARAIVEALRDAEGSRRMAAAARALVESRFSARAMAEGTLGVYQRLLAAHAQK
jgi:glycosyltransferase involved in cell wall biosynthesis